MAKEKLALPALEAFLKQMRPAVAQVIPDWLEVVIPILLGLASYKLFHQLFATAPLCVGSWFLTHWVRDRQIANQPAPIRLAFERFERAKPLRDWYTHSGLQNSAPAPVLQALEESARAWHEAREELRSLPATDALVTEELQKEADAFMLNALSAAGPVVRQQDHSDKDMKRMAEDIGLMEVTTGRIQKQTEHLQHMAASGIDGSQQVGLRDRLAQARAEREAAEAELDEITFRSTLD